MFKWHCFSKSGEAGQICLEVIFAYFHVYMKKPGCLGLHRGFYYPVMCGLKIAVIKIPFKQPMQWKVKVVFRISDGIIVVGTD